MIKGRVATTERLLRQHGLGGPPWLWPPPYHQAIVSFTGCINISFDICDSTFSYKGKILMYDYR